MKLIGIVLGFCFVVIGLTLGGSALGLWNYQLFGSRTEDARNTVFKHSTAHIEGTVRTLRRYQIEYLQTKDPETRCAIAKMVLSESDHVSVSDLPDDLAQFVATVRC